jgi:hypothetical protein
MQASIDKNFSWDMQYMMQFSSYSYTIKSLLRAYMWIRDGK